MELRRYLAIVARFWRPLVIIPLLAGLVALGLTYVISPRYLGTATIQLIPAEVEPRTVTLRSQGGPGTIALGLKDPTELLAQSVIENLRSRAVLEQIVDELGIEQWPEPQGFDAVKARVRGAISDLFALIQYGYVAQGSKRDAAIAAVEQALDAELVRGSYYMRIEARWNDPELASEVANLAVVALSDHMRSIARVAGEEQSVFLKTQVDTARAQMDQARQQLISAGETGGLVGGDSLRQALDAREQALQAQRENALNLAAIQSQRQAVAALLKATEPTVLANRTVSGVTNSESGGTVQTTTTNPAWDAAMERVQALEQDVAAIEARQWYAEGEFKASVETQLADARRRLQVAYQQQRQGNRLPQLVRDQLREQVLTLEQQVAALEAMANLSFEEQKLRNAGLLADARQRLDIARQQLTGTPAQIASQSITPPSSSSSSSRTETSAPNPVYQQLQEQAATLAQQERALNDLQAPLAAQLQAREDELRRLTGADARLIALSGELDLATRIYNDRVTMWSDAQLEAARPVSQTRLIDAAYPPAYPVRPIKYRWAAIGVAAGLALAIIYVFVRANTDTRVRTPDEAEAALGLGLLAIVPSTSTGR